MNKLVLIIFTLVILSCHNAPETEPGHVVQYRGALKNMMHKGDISAKVALIDLEAINNLYALGAFENLKGEIQIFNSKPYSTTGSGDAVIIDNSFLKKATLLVYASVEKWKSFDIPDSLVHYKQLEGFIEQTAQSNGVNVEEPFPFLIEGQAESLDWHVINWKDGDMIHTHEKHKTSGPHGIIVDEEVEVLGFYSRHHHAIFTHHTTNMHLHFRTLDNKLAGHIDDLVLGKGMTLKVPDQD